MNHGMALSSLSDREVAELRVIPDVQVSDEVGRKSGARVSATGLVLHDVCSPSAPSAGRRRRSSDGLRAGFARSDLRATEPEPRSPAMRERSRSDGQQAQTSQVFSFGWNGHGQLGCGDTQARLAPQLLRELGGLSLCGLACGSCHCIAIDAQGGAHAWGDNASGQLGTGDRSDKSTPERVILDGQRVTLAACGARHTLLATARGRVLACGHNGRGQLGLGELPRGALSCDTVPPPAAPQPAAAAPPHHHSHITTASTATTTHTHHHLHSHPPPPLPPTARRGCSTSCWARAWWRWPRASSTRSS